MNQIKLFKTLTIGLLVSNIILMSILLFTDIKEKEPREQTKVCNSQKEDCEKSQDKKTCKPNCEKSCCTKSNPSFFEGLDLDSIQQVAFEEQVKEYKEKIVAIRAEIKENMNLYFSNLKSTGQAQDNELLMITIQELQKTKLETTYKHFESLKELLTEEQKAKFDTHIDKAMKCIIAKDCTNKNWKEHDRKEHLEKQSSEQKG